LPKRKERGFYGILVPGYHPDSRLSSAVQFGIAAIDALLVEEN